MATPVGPLPVGASAELILDAIEISIVYASVCEPPIAWAALSSR